MTDPFQFLQYIPQDQRAAFIASVGKGATAGVVASKTGAGAVASNAGFMSKGGGLDKAGSFAMDNASTIVTAGQGLVELSTNLFGKSGVEKDEDGNRMTTDIYGRPVYSYQNYQNSIDDISDNAKGEVGSSVVSGLGQGLKAGAAIGSLIAPGIGTAIGAGVGVLAGSVAGLIGGKKRKKEMDREVSSREEKLLASQNQFNRDNTSYFEEAGADSISSYLMSQRSLRRYS